MKESTTSQFAKRTKDASITRVISIRLLVLSSAKMLLMKERLIRNSANSSILKAVEVLTETQLFTAQI